jgi:hypothetical protein
VFVNQVTNVHEVGAGAITTGTTGVVVAGINIGITGVVVATITTFGIVVVEIIGVAIGVATLQIVLCQYQVLSVGIVASLPFIPMLINL